MTVIQLAAPDNGIAPGSRIIFDFLAPDDSPSVFFRSVFIGRLPVLIGSLSVFYRPVLGFQRLFRKHRFSSFFTGWPSVISGFFVFYRLILGYLRFLRFLSVK